MPSIYTITPLSPAAAYDGTFFPHGDTAALFALRISFEQTPVAPKTQTPLSCRIEDVESRILPCLSSRGSSVFKAHRILTSPTPGALLISRRDGVQHHISHGGRFVVDYRTLDATIFSAHVDDGTHHTTGKVLPVIYEAPLCSPQFTATAPTLRQARCAAMLASAHGLGRCYEDKLSTA
ncbi:hypothetical protein BDZ89DRAFT_1243562 [Hymenopellis radicata]|nr:hypothetical protein BDZ89DRAFT_1243562 [Hymenopellis radicata]